MVVYVVKDLLWLVLLAVGHLDPLWAGLAQRWAGLDLLWAAHQVDPEVSVVEVVTLGRGDLIWVVGQEDQAAWVAEDQWDLIWVEEEIFENEEKLNSKII